LQFVISPAARAHFPTIQEDVTYVLRTSQRYDRDLRTSNLLVTIRYRSDEKYSGRAWNEIYSVWDRRHHWHLDGKIHLSIGQGCGFAEIATVAAHEARHIGQFHRGRKRFGVLTLDPLTNDECEADAYEFEDKILDKLGL
jgi:hypothetical protein